MRLSSHGADLWKSVRFVHATSPPCLSDVACFGCAEEGVQNDVLMEAIYAIARIGAPVKPKAPDTLDAFCGPPPPDEAGLAVLMAGDSARPNVWFRSMD